MRIKSPLKPGSSMTEMEKYQIHFLESEKETFICNGLQIFSQEVVSMAEGAGGR